MSNDTQAISIRGLNKLFGGFQALRNIDLDVAHGERMVVCGPSGSGKSTLIRCVNSLEEHDSGSITVDGTAMTDQAALAQIRAEAGMVFQQFNLFPHLTILQNLTLGPIKARGLSRADAEDRAMTYLERVRIPDQAHKKPRELSGGQQQRVAIARSLINDPYFLLADEPTGNLDSETTREILDLFAQLNGEGRTIILVTHEDEVAEVAGRVIRLRDGEIQSDIRSREPVQT